MMENIKSLEIFCGSHSCLIVYGAGRVAQIFDEFAQLMHIDFSACIISGLADGTRRFMDRIPIYSVSNYPRETGRKYGVVLALQERYHEDVIPRVRDNFGEDTNIFPITDLSSEEIFNYTKRRKRDDVLFNENVMIESFLPNVERYDIRISEIKSKYTKVKLDYILMYSIGCAWSWIYRYIECQEERDGIFHLYYPVVWFGKEELSSANDAMLNKFSADGIEVISKENVNFWRYFIHQERKFFLVEERCNLFSRIQEFNKFASSYNFKDDVSYISFDDQEKSEGDRKIREMGIGEKFISFCIRDDLYKTKIRKALYTERALDSHKYRNSDPQNFRLAVEHLGQQGLQSVRMGAIVGNKLEWKHVVDYAHDFRTPFMDVYLSSKCRFFISNMSGIQALPQLFSKPLVCLDVSLLTTRNNFLTLTTRKRDLAIFRKFWSVSRNRYLTMYEMLAYETDDGLHEGISAGTFWAYTKEGIVPVNNTPEEIDDVVQEMVARLNGTMIYDEEDERLQRRYWDIIEQYPLKQNFPFQWRVGAKFLKANPWLVE